MFPTGMPGAALVLLRISVAAMLIGDGASHWSLSFSFWSAPLFLVPAFFLCLGFLTPYISTFCCLLQLAVLLITLGDNGFHMSIAILNCGILAVLGPGAYSVDARIFGRRILNLPPRD
jgi:hypothetical protein